MVSLPSAYLVGPSADRITYVLVLPVAAPLSRQCLPESRIDLLGGLGRGPVMDAVSRTSWSCDAPAVSRVSCCGSRTRRWGGTAALARQCLSQSAVVLLRGFFLPERCVCGWPRCVRFNVASVLSLRSYGQPQTQRSGRKKPRRRTTPDYER